MTASLDHFHHQHSETKNITSKPINEAERKTSLGKIKTKEASVSTQDELAELGVSLDEAYSHNKIAAEYSDHDYSNEKAKDTEIKASTKISIQERFQEIQKSEQSVASILATLKVEFADSMDEETSAVIDKYSTLLSPEIFTDKDELEAVETLFYTQSQEFTADSFNSFVHTIYEEPDNIISEVSKQKIEKAFGIPRTPIATGKDLANATTLKDENGDFVYNSKDNALAFRGGVKTYMNADKKPVLLVEGSSRPHPMVVSSETFGDSEAMAKLSNYALIQQVVYDELGQLSNLFGGGEEDEIATPDSSVVTRANKFATLLIGKKAPNTILSEAKLNNLRSALKTLKNPAKMGETQSLNAMAELGMLDNGDFQWEHVSSVGKILRDNQYYKAFEMEQEGAGHSLLLAEIQQSLLHGKEKETKMSTTISSGHFYFYTWNRWSSSFIAIRNKLRAWIRSSIRSLKWESFDYGIGSPI